MALNALIGLWVVSVFVNAIQHFPNKNPEWEITETLKQKEAHI